MYYIIYYIIFIAETKTSTLELTISIKQIHNLYLNVVALNKCCMFFVKYAAVCLCCCVPELC